MNETTIKPPLSPQSFLDPSIVLSIAQPVACARGMTRESRQPARCLPYVLGFLVLLWQVICHPTTHMFYKMQYDAVGEGALPANAEGSLWGTSHRTCIWGHEKDAAETRVEAEKEREQRRIEREKERKSRGQPGTHGEGEGGQRKGEGSERKKRVRECKRGQSFYSKPGSYFFPLWSCHWLLLGN